MCGICGKYDPRGVHPGELAPMLAAITHRGPDDEGEYVTGPIGLGSRRLSIIDVPGGRQPISNETGTVWIVFNGEIYNHRELRHGLEARGHQFRTHSDTEVIVHLYEEQGEACVSALRGMFAFALWDTAAAKLVLARDHLGQKPLFYAQVGQCLWFGSEIKAILAAQIGPRKLNLEALHHYLTLRFIPAPQTMLHGVHKLPPAHVLVWRDGRLRVQRYWALSFSRKLALSEDDVIEALRERLTETVEAHLISDVPVGAYLSGGLDSSTLAAVMARELGRSFKTFAVGVQEQDFNELPYARLAAGQLGTEHVEQSVESNLIQLLPTIIWHLDEPSDPIAACMFYAARLAAQHVKVVVGGDGGDELFAGFDRYLGLGYLARYTALPAFLRRGLVRPVLRALPDSFTYKSLAQKLRWMDTLSELDGPACQYGAATSFFRFSQADKRALFRDELWRQVGGLDSTAVIREAYEQPNAEHPLDRMLYADIVTRLPEHSLMLTDRMTMAHGLEARAPFLDHGLMEWGASLPGSLKLRGRTTKHLLRQLAGRYLPEAIVRREKQGFGFPVAYWFRGPLFPLLETWLMESVMVRAGYFRQDYVRRLLDEHRSRRVDHHVRLWMLLNVDLWHQLLIENESRSCLEERLRTYLQANQTTGF